MTEPSQNNQAFYPLEQYPALKALASQYEIILKELHQNHLWMNWGSDDYDPMGHCQFLKGDWTICPIYFGNYDPYSLNIPATPEVNVEALIASLPNKFPETTALLKEIPTINFAAFSRLRPNTVLAPHSHVTPLSLIFHLGLIVPPKETCGITVNGQTHLWKKPGDAIIFNDNFEHSAWNHSSEDRIILYIDFASGFRVKS